MESDRKTRIADAAIALLGTQGGRGLTHRGVDAMAGLPIGSTSFYCRTRLELLSLALLRHAALDMADLQADGEKLAHRPISPDAIVELLVERVADWLSPAKRARLVARFELFLAASREPELAGIVSQQRTRFLQAAQAALLQAGIAQPAAAPALIVVVDALLLDQVRTSDALMTAEQQKHLFKSLLRAWA